MKPFIVFFFWALAAASFAQTSGYIAESLKTPQGVRFHVTGLDLDAKDRPVVCTRLGDVWRLDGTNWTQVATGLHEPCGLLCQPDGSILVSQKPEVTRLVDTDGDGKADRYQTWADEFEYHNNYHEFNHGLVRDSKGNVFGALNLSHADPLAFNVGGLGSSGGLRGTAYRISPSGAYSTFAWGLRSPAGLGMSPKDELFYTDNQGNWVGTSSLSMVAEGSFHAEPTSLRDHPMFGIDRMATMADEDYATFRTIPSVWLPHKEIANSPGNPVWDTNGGAFGVFEGQVFLGDLTQSNLLRIQLEEVGGRYQGVVFPFLDGFDSGNIRIKFDRKGTLWIGQTARGWGAKGDKDFGLQKVTWDGETVPCEMHTMTLEADGFRVSFTQPMAAESVSKDALEVSSWWYAYHRQYGSPKIDEQEVVVESVELAEDGLSAFIKFAPEKEKLYFFEWKAKPKSTSGEPLGNARAYYTLVNLVAP